jgi:hypothetical protein
MEKSCRIGISQHAEIASMVAGTAQEIAEELLGVSILYASLDQTSPSQTTPALDAPQESGGGSAKELPSLDKEGWRAERRGGLSMAFRRGLTRGGVDDVNREFFRSP